MSGPQDIRVDLAAALEAAGVPAVLDAAGANLPCALVDLPELDRRTSGCDFAATVSVWLLPAAAGGADSWAWIADHLMAAAVAVGATSSRQDVYDRGGVATYGHRLVVPVTIPVPAPSPSSNGET